VADLGVALEQLGGGHDLVTEGGSLPLAHGPSRTLPPSAARSSSSVTLALKVNSLVGIEQAPSSLAVVTGTGALLAMVGNPFFGRMSDRTSSQLGMRRPWMLIGLVGGSLGILMVALAPNIPTVLVGWGIAQLLFNALLAALAAVLPDQSRPLNAAWSPVSWASVCPSRR
jgi:MFS family permease